MSGRLESAVFRGEVPDLDFSKYKGRAPGLHIVEVAAANGNASGTSSRVIESPTVVTGELESATRADTEAQHAVPSPLGGIYPLLDNFLSPDGSRIVSRNSNWGQFVEQLTQPAFQAELISFAATLSPPTGKLDDFLSLSQDLTSTIDALEKTLQETTVQGVDVIIAGNIARSILSRDHHLTDQRAVRAFATMFNNLRASIEE